MDIIPLLRRNERRHLVQLGRRSGDPATALRFHIVARLGLGKTSPEVADELDIARSTVVRAAHVFANEGAAGLYDKRRNNGKPKADDPFSTPRDQAPGADAGGLRLAPAHVDPRAPLPPNAAGWMAVAVCTMGRVLARIGARLGMPKPIVLCVWKRDAREARLAELRALEAGASAREPVLYSDEVDVHLNPKIGRDWMLPGQQRRVVTPGKNEKFYLAGALDVRTGALHTTGTAHKNAGLFCELLELLDKRYGPSVRRIHLIVDNYVIHSAHATRRVLEKLKGRIVLHFLPPYCPDANRIERVWQDFHANVTRNHRCKTMARLLDNAREYVDGYVWRRVTGIDPIIQRAA